jgi:hypothetical protein
MGGFAAFASPNGKYVYYAKNRSVPGLWRVPVDGGTEEPVLPRSSKPATGLSGYL